ncbi:MAG TPA: hypothetical protein PKY78_04310 [Candidatus Omnitrophota bacterium]|nr:hypothetical protein [Candidatus Omnitrophota bacterium]HPS20194.1 hypothetical protein [Candidatus Omnitrophota bacterium]
MKYRTVIEVVCEASDKDEALNNAGEYLRGKSDSIVGMKTKTLPLGVHRAIKYGVPSLMMLFLLGTILLKGSAMQESSMAGSGISIPMVYTVQPELKTQDSKEFKTEWSEKKDAAVLDYIKN